MLGDPGFAWIQAVNQARRLQPGGRRRGDSTLLLCTMLTLLLRVLLRTGVGAGDRVGVDGVASEQVAW